MARQVDSDENPSGLVTAPGVDLLLGTVLDGRFKVVEPIGSGGMGRVYRAMQLPMNRPVALKVLDYNYGAGTDEAFRRRFLVEAALTAKLRHPNTVTVIDSGCTKQGIFYIAMEYLEGETLSDLLASEVALNWRRVLAIAQQVARSLREAHRLGVVHRDLKPANVFLLDHDDDTDQVKVLDFGLVKSFVPGQELEGRAITQQGMLMGSPAYMAPEQADRNAADPRSDVYSLGVVMFEALTGKPPFTGRGEMEVILKHVHEAVPPLRVPQGKEPPPAQLEALVRRCLEKSPMDRFQSMDEVLAAMHEVAAPGLYATPGEGTPAPRKGTQPRLPAAQPRSHYAPALLFLLAVLVGGAVTWFLRRDAAETPRAAAVEAEPPEAAATFRVDSQPQGAAVVLGDEELGVTPLEFEVPKGEDGRASVELVLALDGYVPLTVKAGGSGPLIEISQVLQPQPEALAPGVGAPRPGPRPVKHSAATKRRVRQLKRSAPVAPLPTSKAKLGEDDEPAPREPNELKRPEP